jgi:predicted DNA-binding transcriptional regulator AlpA
MNCPAYLGMSIHTPPQTPNSPHGALREGDASRYLGMSRAWLRQSRMRGRGPAFIRIGRSVRYRLADLEAWLDAHRVDPGCRGGR